jgi:hypothetical protein
MALPLKMEPFQAIRIPSEAPSEGTKAYLLNRLGAIFWIAEESKWSFLVSWIQKIAQLHYSILALIALHLSAELRPLTFQLRIFQLRILLLSIEKRQGLTGSEGITDPNLNA